MGTARVLEQGSTGPDAQAGKRKGDQQLLNNHQKGKMSKAIHRHFRERGDFFEKTIYE